MLASAAPAGAAEVARIDGGSLDARDDRRSGFCLRLTEGDSPFGGGGSGTCGRAPWRARRSNLIAWVVDRDRVLTAGAVPAAVVRAEAELADGRRIGFDTVAGPRYGGRHAGKLRFFLAALPIADRSDSDAGGLVAVRFFAADGTLAGAAASDREGTRIGRRQLLLRERERGRSTTVTAETRSRSSIPRRSPRRRSRGPCDSPPGAAGAWRPSGTAMARASPSRCGAGRRRACSAYRMPAARSRRWAVPRVWP